MPDSDSKQMLLMEAASGGTGGVVVGTVVPGSGAEKAGLRGVRFILPDATAVASVSGTTKPSGRVILGDVITGVDIGCGTVRVRSVEELADSLAGFKVDR